MKFDEAKIKGCSQYGSAPKSTADDLPDGKTSFDGTQKPAEQPAQPIAAAPKKVTSQSPQDTAPAKAKDPASTTPGKTSGSETGDSQVDVQADLAACRQAQSRATQCCTNPASCVSLPTTASVQPAPPTAQSGAQGIRDYCQQMQQAGLSNTQANNSAASACYSSQSSCKSACSGLVSKYQDLVDNCSSGNCSSYQDALSQLQSGGQTCSRYDSVVSTLGQQAVSSSNSSTSGYQCDQATNQANPASAGGGGLPTSASDSSQAKANDPYGCSSDPSSAACQSCTQNPNSANCRALAQAQAAQVAKGNVGFNESSSKKATDGSGFNVADTSTVSAQPIFGENKPPQPQNIATIANNSGGAIPGSGGTTSASLGGSPGSGRAGGPGGSGVSTDILQGERSGGYTTASTGSGNGFDDIQDLGRGPGRGLASQGAGVGGQIDLKHYLPGGTLDPNRRFGGLAAHGEILGRFEDLWQHVSDRFREKCRLGVLFDCH